MSEKTDRELLELAAIAHWGDEIDDVVFVAWSEQDNAILYTHADNQDHNGQDCDRLWNPLSYGDDALKLSVKLDMDVMSQGKLADGTVVRSVIFPINGDYDCMSEPVVDDDHNAAICRAIVRAAASIGESMKGQKNG